jgi:RNA polymerase sigma-70 factor (ECF subfamily)
MQEMTTKATPFVEVSGDATASQEFSTVAEAGRPRIFQFLLASMRDDDLAETLTQECFLQAHRNWSKFRGDSSPLTWLTRIAINQQKDYWRNRRMQFWRQTYANSIDMNEASEQLPCGERSPEQRVLARERVGQLWKAVDRLSNGQKTVLLLRYAEEQEFREIARTTGLQESSVKSHLSRALAKVRIELGRETMT